MAKQAELVNTRDRCLVCKGRLASGLYPICQKPYCYNRTVSLFESYSQVAELMKEEHKKGGIPKQEPEPEPEGEGE